METIEAIQTQIAELKRRLTELRQARTPEPVRGDYSFQCPTGEITLGELFGDKSDLLLVHNMGAACSYCTMWADGFSGYLRHITSRAAFVLVSPDSVDHQQQLAAARGWKFRMVQDQAREFTSTMGFWNEKDGWWPGISAFHRAEDGTITRTGRDDLGPMDDYCPPWPMFTLLKDADNGFEPN